MISVVQNAAAGVHGEYQYIPAQPGQPPLPLACFPVNFLGLQKLTGNYNSYLYVIGELY